MKRIKILKNGVITHQNSDVNMSDADKDAWLAREIANGSFGLPGDYSVVQEDMTAEIDAKVADEAAQEQARQFLKSFKKSDIVTLADAANVIAKLIKHIRADR